MGCAQLQSFTIIYLESANGVCLCLQLVLGREHLQAAIGQSAFLFGHFLPELGHGLGFVVRSGGFGGKSLLFGLLRCVSVLEENKMGEKMEKGWNCETSQFLHFPFQKNNAMYIRIFLIVPQRKKGGRGRGRKRSINLDPQSLTHGNFPSAAS